MKIVKLVCINNENHSDLGLTIGNIYDCSLDAWNKKGDLYIKTDKGKQFTLWRGRFITLAEWREQQINSILNE